MAAIRFKAEFDSFSGDRYTIEIWDRSYSGDPIPFNPDSRGFALTQEASDRISTIMGTECQFVMYAENTDHELFITDLIASEEGRFVVNITKGTTPAAYWRGVILPDIGSYEDASYPYQINITATDGIASLKDIKYNNAGAAYTGKARLMDHLINALSKIRYVDVLFTPTQHFVSSFIDWWENDHAATASDPCALYQTYADHSVFYKDEKGVKDYLSCYEVIENILTNFNARITFNNGTFWIEQIPYRTAATVVGRNYDRSKNYLGSGNFSAINTINQTNTLALEATGRYEFLPPLKEHRHTFLALERFNLLSGVAAFTDTNFTAVTVPKPINSNSGNTYFRISANLQFTLSSNTAPGSAFQPFVCLFRFRLKIGSLYARRTYTLTPQYQVQYSQIDFVSGVEYIYYAVPISNGFFLGNTTSAIFSFTNLIELVTTQIGINSDDFEFNFEFIRYEKYDGTTITGTTFDLTYQLGNQTLLILPDIATDEYEYTSTNYLFPNNSVVTQTKSLLGTSENPNALGALWVYKSSAYELANLWGPGTDPKNKRLEYLLCEFIVAGQYVPIRKLQGNVFGNLTTLGRVVWRDSVWLLMRGTWTANDDTMSGEWFELKYGTGFSTSAPVKKIVTANDPQIPTVPQTSSSTGPSYELVAKPPGTLIAPLSLTTTSALQLNAGPITTIGTAAALTGGDIYAGDTLVVLNPLTGDFNELTVATTPSTGATSIAVTGTLTASYPQNSLLIKKPKIGTFSLPPGTANDLLYHNGTEWAVFPEGSALQVLRVNAAGTALEWATLSTASGTVTSVGLSLPAIFTVSGSPVTTSGTLTAALATQAINTVFAGPSSGSAAAPTFRTLAAADIPNLDTSKLTTGTLPIARGGTGLAALGTALQVLRVNSGATALEYATLSAITGTLVAGRIAIADGAGSLTTDDVFLYDASNNRLTIGATSHGSYLYNLLGPTQSTALSLFDFGATVNGSNVYGQIRNGSNFNGSSNTILNIQVGGSIAGDPIIQWQIPGTGGTTWSAGIDNSANDVFRIAPDNTPSVGSAGLTISKDSRVGINNSIPLVGLDMDAVTDGILMPSGSTAQRPTTGTTLLGKVLRTNNAFAGLEYQTTNNNVQQLTSSLSPLTTSLTWYSGAGTTAATGVTFGTDSNVLVYQLTFTTTSSPTGNVDVFKYTFPSTAQPNRIGRVFITPRSFTAASPSLCWWVSAQSATEYTIAIAGTLSATTQYILNIEVRY